MPTPNFLCDMQKRIILFLTGLLFLLPVIAKDYTVDNLPNVHLQNEYRYTINPDGVIDTQSQNTIDRLCRTLEDSTGIETVVAIVNSIGNEDCFDFCHELLNSWGVGQKGKDNGLVVLLVTDQRCVQFYTGYGLEGILPDAICKRIQTEQMIPYLKDEKWSEGMVAGMEAVYKRLITYNEGDVSQEDEDDDDLVALLIFMGLMLLGCVVIFIAVWVSNRCPACKKHNIIRVSSRLISKKNGMKIEGITYECKDCGHIFEKQVQSIDENYTGHSGRHYGGGMPRGGFGGGSFGGGFSGGSFGGGRGGGGGAGSRF